MSDAPTFDDVWRMFQEMGQQMKETDRKFQETDRQMKETDRKLQELSRQLGSHGNRLGEFVQEMVRPAVVRLFKSRDLPVHQVMPNIVAYDDNGRFIMEIDLLVINATTAIAVECKSKLTVEDVTEHLERLEGFKDCFPQYRDYTLLGAVAGIVLPDDVGRHAYRRGLYVLAQSGDGVELGNDVQFEPKEW